MDFSGPQRHPVLVIVLFVFCVLFDVFVARLLSRPLRMFAARAGAPGASFDGSHAVSSVRTGDGVAHGPAAATDEARGDFFAMMAFFQMTFVIALCFIPFTETLSENADYYPGLVVLALFCIAVNLVLMLAMRRYDDALIQEQRASVLAERLDACLADYDALVADVERVSAMRHDLRNHLQVIEALAERGDFALAERHLDEVLAELGEGRAA